LVPKVRVGRKAITNIQRRLDEAIRHRPTQESIPVRLVRASAVIRGWSNYFKIVHNFSQVANGLDHKAFWIAVKAICRKADISTAKCLSRHRFKNTIGVHEACTLARFADTAASHHYAAPKPYQPGRNIPTWKTTSGKRLTSTTSTAGLVAETSSGRLWSATAFIAVVARSWFHPRPRARIILSLSTALPTSTWQTAWITSRRSVYDATSSRQRGKHALRIIWKARMLGNLHVRFGVGAGVKLHGLHHRAWRWPWPTVLSVSMGRR
jgi:hypothetical protein